MLRAPQLHFSLKTCLGRHGKIIRSELKESKCDSCDSCDSCGFQKGKQVKQHTEKVDVCNTCAVRVLCAEVPIKLLGEVVASSSSSLPFAAKAGHRNRAEDIKLQKLSFKLSNM